MIESEAAYAASRAVMCSGRLPAHVAAVFGAEIETCVGATFVGFGDRLWLRSCVVGDAVGSAA